jgi:hypothetical protein
MNKKPLCQETDEGEVTFTKRTVPAIPEDLLLSRSEKVLIDDEVNTATFTFRF